MQELRAVGFRAMKDGTAADYRLLDELEHVFARTLPSRVMRALSDLADSFSGYQVDRLEHSLISATMAERDGADLDWIVTALIHDVGDMLAPSNHSQLAAAIGAPYLRDECTWVMKTHGIFQMIYYAHFTGGDQYARAIHKDHPLYQVGIDFCERWDQSAFDPDYDRQPLEHFAPMVEEVFSRKPWDPAVIRKGEHVPLGRG